MTYEALYCEWTPSNLAQTMPNENIELTEDKLLGGKVIIFQPKKGYRVAVDSCLLAAAVPARAGDKILDLGVGTGAVSLCIRARVPQCKITGIDKNTGYLGLAQQSVDKNHWESAISLHVGDVCKPPRILQPSSFDYVVANPPYFDEEAYFKSPHVGKSEAHANHGSKLPDWVNCAKAFLKQEGIFFVIFPSDREETLLSALKAQFRDIGIFRVFSNEKDTPIRLIVAAKAGLEHENRVYEAGKLEIRDEKGDYTSAARSILWDGTALNMALEGSI
ncbi:MAG: methyltransferase domain-containing protein [Alphaproteobacteria bacterium]|nr:methyltransferase domain-containing protein [Alphaproteobacteria bacterium]